MHRAPFAVPLGSRVREPWDFGAEALSINVVFDRGYTDYDRFERLAGEGVYFARA